MCAHCASDMPPFDNYGVAPSMAERDPYHPTASLASARPGAIWPASPHVATFQSPSRGFPVAGLFMVHPLASRRPGCQRPPYLAGVSSCERLGLTGNSTPNGLDPTPNKDRERVRLHRNHSDRRSNPCADAGRDLHSLANTGRGEMCRRARTTPTTLRLLELRQALEFWT